MKRISLITIHLGANFGSILQTIATVKTLEKLDMDCTVINYIPPRCTWKNIFRSHNLYSFFKRVIVYPLSYFNNYIYQKYLTKYIHLSYPIYKDDNFIKKCPKADYYITGSDQVWNSIYNEGIDYHYYFEGFPKDIKKISYSSSIGNESLDKKEYMEMKRMLSSYSALSVRESKAKDIIERMGYEVEHLLDPTFMITKDEWKLFMSDRLIEDPYLLVYTPYDAQNKDSIYKSARIVAENLNLKVITFTWNFFNEKRADSTIKFANPGDFLSLMYYADFVITSSFHGTAFSINLNKPFCVYLPTGFSNRIESLLVLCNLENRIVSPSKDFDSSIIDKSIDYDHVNCILETEREKSFRFLKSVLI